MATSCKAIAQALGEIVGEAGVVPYPALDTRLQAEISQAVGLETKLQAVIYPQTQAELSEVMASACRNQWRVLPCGNGTKLSWGGVVQNVDLIVSTQRLNRLIEHAAGDLTVTVEAGMKFSDLQTTLARAGQFLALDPAHTTLATLGGIVATRDAGSLRQRYGGVRDMVLGISLIRADGQRVKAGGRVVKNVAGYDLTKLFCGSFGTLGMLSEITFRLYPLPEASQTTLLTGSAEAVAEGATMLATSVLTPTALDLLSTQLVADLEADLGVLGRSRSLGLVVRFQSLQTSVEYQAAKVLKIADALGLKAETLVAAEETRFWQQTQDLLWRKAAENSQSVCAFGVLPARTVATLIATETACHQYQVFCRSLIHLGSGLGLISLEGAEMNIYRAVLELRALCERSGVESAGNAPRQGEFLTVLEAPLKLKRQLDVWGYTGNALDLMHKIKQQFDPQNLLSPHRFIGGI